MKHQELIEKIERLPSDRLAKVARLVESIISGEEYRGALKDVVAEVIEKAALARAIDAGRETPRVPREEIFQLLENAV